MLVMIDFFSKYMWTVLIREKAAASLVPDISHIYDFWTELLLHSDNGRKFCNSSMRSMLEEFQVRHIRSRTHCPWIQGQVERANQTINK